MITIDFMIVIIIFIIGYMNAQTAAITCPAPHHHYWNPAEASWIVGKILPTTQPVIIQLWGAW